AVPHFNLAEGQWLRAKSRFFMKSEIYQFLYAVNECLAMAGEHLDKLREFGILLPEFTDLRRTACEQMRSEINCRIALVLHTGELADSARLEKERLELEKRLNLESS